MSGRDNATKEDWGVNYRAFDDLFQISEDRQNFFAFEIGVQMIEIYNEQIRDLLSTGPSQKKLGILTTPQSHGLAVPGASLLLVQSTQDVIDLMKIGLANRSVSATAMNERSSRSHRLHLVDLAGSERVDRSDVSGDRLREAQHINKSLAALGDVIFALAQKSHHVPYRNSKLTQVLEASLGGRAKTLMFVQINPDVNSYTESLRTVKFAERVSGIELGAAKSSKGGRDVRELMDQVASLKDMIARKDEEIERLQLLKDTKSPQATLSRNTSSKAGPSSPKASGVSPKFSSGDENERAIQSSRSLSDLKSLRGSPRHSRRASGIPINDDDIVSSNADIDERLSDVNDGDLLLGTDTDRPVGARFSRSSSRQLDISDKAKTPARIPQPSKSCLSGASRMSAIKSSPKTSTVLKKPGGSGSSSPVTPRRRLP